MIEIRTVDQLDITPGARVFYRVDYNVPLEDARITDTTRIDETLPTLHLLRERGAALVVASHLGRPKGERKEKYSLKPVRDKLAEMTGLTVKWSDDTIGENAEAAASELNAGEILLLENLRFNAGEEKNDEGFAAKLRRLAQFYVNDAFGASHRAHASIEALPRMMVKERTAGGLLLAKELQFLQKVTEASDRPFVALLGGAKIAGKIEPLEALVKLADKVLIGGGMANTFLAADGVAMGGSLVDRDSIDVAKRIMAGGARAEVVLPEDVALAESGEVVPVTKGLTNGQKAYDIGPKTIERFTSELRGAKTIFWNGPMGVFEEEAFAKGTMAMAR
ncbi:MAG TPA: phosphoglycerate kinase, partial [Thermoanaerobaculia bacterium]|nr:phosphoglycerate kinase [Thermoanaerobaculia bacterium]